MYGSDGPGGGSGGPGGGSGGPGGHWASSAVGNISNPPVSEAGSIFPGAPYIERRATETLSCRKCTEFRDLSSDHVPAPVALKFTLVSGRRCFRVLSKELLLRIFEKGAPLQGPLNGASLQGPLQGAPLQGPLKEARAPSELL